MVTSARQEFQLLITDDNAAFRQVLREVLEDRPFLVLHEAESGEEAMDVVQRRRIDIVLLDIMLPDADGLQILGRLRAHSKFARLPVILMTGKAQVADVKAGLAAGADGYVSKPFKVSALVAAVNLVLGKG